MFSQAFHDLSKPKVALVLEFIKKSEGLGVSDLAKALDMSYMGVKQICLKLEDQGYLKTWRVPRQVAGRPEKIYQLTNKCDALFPQAGVDLTLNLLESVRKLYGENAPEKLLFHHFEELQKKWIVKVAKGKSLVEKATRLVELKRQEGCFCDCDYQVGKGFVIEEYHHPMKGIFNKYPSAVNLELKVMEKLLGTTVNRHEKKLQRAGTVVFYQIVTL